MLQLEIDCCSLDMVTKSTLSILLVLFVCLIAVTTTNAQVSDTLTITSEDQIIQRIVEDNRQLKAASFRTSQLFERSTQLGVLPDPMTSLTAFPFPVYTAEGSQQFQIQISQSLPYPGKLALKSDAGEWGARASEASEKTLQEKLIHDGLTLLSETKKLIRQKDLIDSYRKVLRDFESIAESRYTVGTGTQQAVLKAQLERNALDARESDVDQLLKGTVRKLAVLLDRPIIVSEAQAWTWNHDLSGLHGQTEDSAIASRPEMSVLQALEQQAISFESLAKKDWRPDFTVGITYFNIANESSPPQASGRDALALMVGIKVPIHRTRLKSRLEETRIRQSEVDAQTWWTQRSIREEYREVNETIKLLLDQRDLYDGALLPQAQTTLLSTISAYTTGEVGFLDLLDAERMVFQLSWQFENVSARLEKALYSLEKASGTIRLKYRSSL